MKEILQKSYCPKCRSNGHKSNDCGMLINTYAINSFEA